MHQSDLFIQPKRPWNAGRLIGPKAPLKPRHICASPALNRYPVGIEVDDTLEMSEQIDL